MGKKILSLCMALALCLGLLPVTALAVDTAPQTLYVGSTTITAGYWTSSDDGTNWTSQQKEPTGDSYIYYDGQGTLKLHNATIQRGSNTVSPPYGAGIYALCSSNQPVALTIELIGTNTITGYYGIYVNAEISADSNGTDASLTITSENNGSLEVSGSNYGIFVKSGTGNASLTINDASVVAKTTQTYSSFAGVYVQSSAHATSSPQLSLAVNGGSLTTSASKGNDGIQFYVGSSEATGATTSLTVTNNAIVDARNGGISASRILETLPTPTPTGDNSSGIVFDGSTGAVYGTVELQEDLEIGEGESLTIGDGASLNTGSHEVIVNGGTLTGGDKITGTVKYAPTITTESLPNGTVNEEYSQTLAATGSDTITWSIESGGTLPTGLSLNGSTGAITGTPTAAGTYNFTVKAESSYGSDSKELSITISVATSVSVTGVTLNKTSTELTVGQSETLTAAVEPSNATNKNVTWSSSAESVATVEDGKVTAVGAGEATITVTTEDGGFTDTCEVTVNAAPVPVTGVTLSQTQESLYSNRTPNTLTLTATVAPDNATNKAVTWSTSNSTVATVDANGLITAVAPGTAAITVTTTDGSFTATCTVTVSRYSSGGSSSRPTPSLSDQAIDKIEDARPGDTVEITLRPGRTTLEREVFEELAGQDITLEIDAGDGVLWTVSGLDIPEDTRLHDLDLDVDLGDSGIPATVLNAVTGEIDTVQLSLAHDGEFGFTMTLSAPLGRDNADYWANLYWYNERTEELEFQQAARIADDGTAEFDLDHASDYAIVIDDRSHEPVDLPFNDVPESYWAYDAIQYVYGEGLMAGTSGSTFNPEGTTTRGQIVTILWRLSGSPVVNYLMDFDDVDPAAYYAEAIRWATSEGIAGGYGGGVFGPDDPITREQLATMLWRYAQTEGYDVSVGEDTNILSYTDALDVAEYAIPAMQWACGAGIISGTGDGSTLTPQGEATRAQVSVMLMRFCELDK